MNTVLIEVDPLLLKPEETSMSLNGEPILLGVFAQGPLRQPVPEAGLTIEITHQKSKTEKTIKPGDLPARVIIKLPENRKLIQAIGIGFMLVMVVMILTSIIMKLKLNLVFMIAFLPIYMVLIISSKKPVITVEKLV